MTERQGMFRSLNAKMLYIILAAALVAAVAYFIINTAGNLAVDKIYMSKENSSARKAEIYANLSSYITTNKVRGDDSAAIARWTQDNEYITILVYKGSDLSMSVEGGKAQLPGSNFVERVPHTALYSKLYPMRFADGVYQIAIGDYTQDREYLLNRFIAIIAASIAFTLVMLLYVRRLSLRIILLSREALEIGAGDLERPITVRGADELSMLAQEVDRMRSSVIERMGNERRAWEANSELITAISHDIRTPMTTLIGYLGLLNESGFQDAARCRQFSASAYDKAMELKDLTDELFKYFLVFGRAELEMEMEPYEGRLLLEQLLGEAEFDLSDAGFTVEHNSPEFDCTVTTDPMYLKRVVDNLVSNLKKYADRDRPVTVETGLEDGFLSVRVSNYTARSMDRVESTKIGIRTCRKIMEHMGGSFRTERGEDSFHAEFTLPAAQQQGDM